MISVTLNGESRQYSTSLSIAEFVSENSLKPNSIAIVVNQHLVPRSEWTNRQCQDGDQIEVFSVVAGG
ncbi:sulfur carrier protein ThiS [Shewanella sp. WXL01]|uniref:Sulfur carrier protein ThiS n=1 Tax=Shewanella maritima TaxID=2520507 RepID=A0A411PMG2_9GAMM|nr:MULTISPECIES: sulfur carrier protein ThiS [Shewanella]NKF52603.1 sulfur carrier protein ThiS [Shewanella sp. WXL01]QBF84714.1 sulfur carrier protein ThiS [Shewanella maritima]